MDLKNFEFIVEHLETVNKLKYNCLLFQRLSETEQRILTILKDEEVVEHLNDREGIWSNSGPHEMVQNYRYRVESSFVLEEITLDDNACCKWALY